MNILNQSRHILNNSIHTEPWWLSGLMCQSIINPMLKVEGSNPGASILKFGLFQFSKWLCLDKNNNLGISVALLVLNDWTGVNAKSYSE